MGKIQKALEPTFLTFRLQFDVVPALGAANTSQDHNRQQRLQRMGNEVLLPWVRYFRERAGERRHGGTILVRSLY